jgi:hypothetical protein
MQFAQICDRVESKAGEIDPGVCLAPGSSFKLDTTSIARVKITDADGKLQLRYLRWDRTA